MQALKDRSSFAGSRVALPRWASAMVGVALLSAAVVTPVRVGVVVGHSMEPVLRPGQPFLFVKRGHAAEPVSRGEVVLVRLNGETCVKRVFAVSGDEFWSVRTSTPPVRATPLQLGESVKRWKLRFPNLSFRRIRIPTGTVYVLGDGAWSRDSRDVGPVPVSDVLGKVILPAGECDDPSPTAQTLRDLPPRPVPRSS